MKNLALKGLRAGKKKKKCQPQKEKSAKFIPEYFDIINKLWIKKEEKTFKNPNRKVF